MSSSTLPQSAPARFPPHSKTGGIEPFTRRQASSPDSAFVDWLHFTFRVTSLRRKGNCLNDHDVVLYLSTYLEPILGYGVTQQHKSRRFFYNEFYTLGDNWGLVCIGGQNDTVMVSVTGEGAMAAKEDWQRSLYEFLITLDRPRITRVDLARDFFNGEYTVDLALADYHAGAFGLGARMPDVEQRGNWIKPNGKGRSLYIGNRSSGKVLRVYEKGLQLGKGFSQRMPKWVRVEGELHNKDREIPLDVLLYPGQYLAGMYPALSFISATQTRVKTRKSTREVTYDAAVHILRHQYGKYLYVMRGVEGTEEAVLDLLIRVDVPKRLVVPDYRYSPPPLQRRAVTQAAWRIA